ncbi:MAG: kdpE [Chloroflexi bacterium]|nr:kdpE [Chloroflexota bacterium]
MSVQRILVVDDEPAIRRTLRVNLSARGYEVDVAETGDDALIQMGSHPPHLLILDLMLPGLSGLDLCATVRSQWKFPILVLSARGEEHTKVRALDLGADDYLTKPFGMDELLARVRALLRRPTTAASNTGVVLTGSLAVNLDTRTATLKETALDLTAREFDVLAYLAGNTGKVVTHRQLLAEVWGPEYNGETQYLRVFINRLRRKIEDDPAHPRLIVTEPGVGYRLLPALQTQSG